MTVCIQCALRTLVTGEAAPVFDRETPEQHLARVHPNQAETQRERRELEAKLAAMFPDGKIPGFPYESKR